MVDLTGAYKRGRYEKVGWKGSHVKVFDTQEGRMNEHYYIDPYLTQTDFKQTNKQKPV